MEYYRMKISDSKEITSQSTHYLDTDYVGLQEICPHCREPLFFLFQMNCIDVPQEFKIFWKIKSGFLQIFFCPHCLQTHKFDNKDLAKNIIIRNVQDKHTRDGFHFQPKSHDLALKLSKIKSFVVTGWEDPIKGIDYPQDKDSGIWVPESVDAERFNLEKKCSICNQSFLPFITIYNGKIGEKEHTLHILRCKNHEKYDFSIVLNNL